MIENLTSIFAFVHLGISTTILNTLPVLSASNGISWNGETISFSFSVIKVKHMKL